MNTIQQNYYGVRHNQRILSRMIW